MYLIVGLGNPGAKYAHTRHNVGFDVVDALARKLGVTIGREREEALLGECFIAGQKTILALPQTYMNLSGEAVSRLVRWYRLPPENLMVVYDDVDLPQGTIRIRKNGSACTHNGMRSIIYQLGFDDFPRVRVGIGHPDGQRNLVSHVLGAPDAEEKELLLAAMNSAADAVELIVHGELREAQARFNKRPKKEKPKAEPAEEPLVLMPANKAGQGEANE